MDKTPPKLMTPLDEFVTPAFLYALKLFLPYAPSYMQRTLAIFLKFFELKITLGSFYGFGGAPRKYSTANILDDLKPYMDQKEQNMMDQMESMASMMEMMQQMSDSPSVHGEEEISPFDLMKGMLDPEQQNIFNMFTNSDTQGGSDHERMDGSPCNAES